MTKRRCMLAAALIAGLCAVTPSAVLADPPMNLIEFLVRLGGPSADLRYEAVRAAPLFGAQAIEPLGKMLAVPRKPVAEAARLSLEWIVRTSSEPGRGEVRAEVTAALFGLIGSERPLPVRVEALRLLGEVATDGEVPFLAGLLADKDVRETAVQTLDRIPGAASGRALADALGTAPEEFLPAIVIAVGHHRAGDALPKLNELAEGSDEKLAVLAVEAIGRIGEPSAATPLLRLVKRGGKRGAAAQDSVLRIAEAFEGKADQAAARELHGALLALKGAPPHVKAAAVLGLGRSGDPSVAGSLLEAMQDESPAVRASAMDALIAMKGTELDAGLTARLASAPPAMRAAILRVLGRRRAPGTAELLKEAAKSTDPEVRVTALSMLGGLDDPSLAPLLADAARRGSPDVRKVALKSYIGIANALLAQEKDQALAMYHQALDLAGEADERRLALAGIAAVASPQSLDRVRQLLANSGVEEDAALAYVAVAGAIGAAGEEKRAIDLLTALVSENVSMRVAAAALAKLRALGADTSGFAGKSGYIAKWFILGPLPFGGEDPLAKQLVDPKAIDLAASVSSGGKSLAWKQFTTDDLQGTVALHEERLFGRIDSRAAYALAEVNFFEERKLRLKIGSDDGVICWLNGEQVHANDTIRALSPDEDSVDVVFKPGANRILLKISQGGGEWQFTCRITDRQNRPIDLTKR